MLNIYGHTSYTKMVVKVLNEFDKISNLKSVITYCGFIVVAAKQSDNMK